MANCSSVRPAGMEGLVGAAGRTGGSWNEARSASGQQEVAEKENACDQADFHVRILRDGVRNKDNRGKDEHPDGCPFQQIAHIVRFVAEEKQPLSIG